MAGVAGGERDAGVLVRPRGPGDAKGRASQPAAGTPAGNFLRRLPLPSAHSLAIRCGCRLRRRFGPANLRFLAGTQFVHCPSDAPRNENGLVKSYRVEGDAGLKSLHLRDADPPDCLPGCVRVAVKAASLNYRDLGILRGGYVRNDKNPVVPLSDAAGVVTEIGANVDSWKSGDRVTLSFVQDWIDGRPDDAVLRTSLGGSIDGVLREEICVPAHGLVPTPDGLTDIEASCFPCAGVTAWHALFGHRRLTAADSVLLLGTGGVSMFALDLAKSVGATVIQTSSSDEKLRRAVERGADKTVNYRSTPNWADEVKRLTDGRGVDFVVEVGGPGTLPQSLQAIAVGGQISLIGVLDDPAGTVNPLPAMFNVASIQGIYVGSRHMLSDLFDHAETHGIRPVVDRVFSFDEATEAYAYFKSQQHVGKVVIELP